jgi:serine/threonine protein kinase
MCFLFSQTPLMRIFDSPLHRDSPPQLCKNPRQQGPPMKRLGKYEIISEIGRGAMGAVYKARDPPIGRLVAVKTIGTGLSAQANSFERFYQEVRSAGALQHPNIITIYELGQEKNTPFIAMEYVEGGSLDHLIE